MLRVWQKETGNSFRSESIEAYNEGGETFVRRFGFSEGKYESNDNIVIRVGTGRARSVAPHDAGPSGKTSRRDLTSASTRPSSPCSSLTEGERGVCSSVGRISISLNPIPISTRFSPSVAARWRSRGRDCRRTRRLRVLPTTYETRGERFASGWTDFALLLLLKICYDLTHWTLWLRHVSFCTIFFVF